MKMYRTINLQFFAEAPETEEPQFEIEDEETAGGPVITENDDGSIEIEDEETEEPAEQEQEEQESEETEQEEEQSAKPDKKNETANAVIAERRKWQERMKKLETQAKIAERLMKNTGVSDMNALQAQLDAYEAQALEQQGYDAQTAQAIVSQKREMEQLRRDLQSQKFDIEAAKLKDDPFFADIDDWRDELEPIALSTGQTLESVYMAQRGRERMKEYQRELEHRAQASRSKKNAARVNTAGGGAPAKRGEKVDLTPDQLAIAKIAVKNGTFKSIEEYAKYAKK